MEQDIYSGVEVYWYTLANKSLMFQGMSSANYYYADSVTYENGVYKLNNPTSYSWSDNYQNLRGKYTCLSRATSCSSISYVEQTGSSYMYYVTMNNGETYDSIINALNQQKWIYGNDISWDGNQYTLVDTVESSPINWSTDRTTIASKYHYTCSSTSSTCTSVNYIYKVTDENRIDFLILNNGVDIEGAKNEMFSNTNNSNAKNAIDTWYEENMTDYTSYLEDTVWCNDRSFYSGFLKGKDENGTSDNYFGAYGRNVANSSPSLDCPNRNDSFTVNSENGNGALTYPVALLTVDELTLAGNVDSYLVTGAQYWTLSPYDYDAYAEMYTLDDSGGLRASRGMYRRGVRPSVSFAPGVSVTDGDGSSTSPYEIFTD